MNIQKNYRLSLYLVMLAFLVAPCHAQDTYPLTGTVLSGAGKPVSNVSINIAGSTRLPVVTDSTGRFKIDSVTGREWVIVTPTGNYSRKRFFLNRMESIRIYLAANDMPSGDDFINLMQGRIPRKDVIPAFSELNVDDISHSAVHSIDQYMQGKSPGVFVVNHSGMPGSGAFVSIRGVNSINATNQPLYVIDGIPLTSTGIFGSNLAGFAHNPLLDINPADISRTYIVRDPVLTSTYGSRASNGLVMIETLDPSVTQTTIELDLRLGYSLVPNNLIPQLNADQCKSLFNEVAFSSGVNEEEIREYLPGLFITKEDENYIDYQHNTDWQKLIFDNAFMSAMNVKVKGGDEIANYGLSFGYTNGSGIIKTTGYQAYNLRFVGRLNIFTWLKMNAGVSLNTNNSTLKEAATAKETSPILASLAKAPFLNPYQYDREGNELQLLAEVDELGTSNPLAIIQNYEARNSNYGFMSNLGLEGNINEFLSLHSNFNISYGIMKEQIFQPNRGMELYYENEAYNVSKALNNELNTFYNHTYLRFNRSFGTNHSLTSNTGFHILTDEFQMDWGLTKNAHRNDQYRDLDNGQDNLREMGGENRIWNSATLYEYLTYTFQDKYIVNGSLTFDGSSRVGSNADNTVKIGDIPFGMFYSFGLAWRISDEFFLRDISFLEDLKLRLTAGKSGNDDIGESSARNYYKAINYRTTVGLYPAVIRNDRLTYETVTQLNGGLDLSLYGNRVSASIDLYKSTSNDMIIYLPVEAYLGYDYRLENGGKMENKGLEFRTYIRILDRQSFKWDFQASFSTLKNQVLELEGEKTVHPIPGGEKINTVGAAAYSFYGYVYKGVYSTQEAADEAGLISDRGIPYRAGDAIFEDLSGPEGEKDGIINEFDKTVIGSSLPDYYGGIYNSFTFRRWSLSGFIQFVKGNDIFNYVRYKNERMADLANQSVNVLNRWQYEGHDTDVPWALWQDPVGNSEFSTRWIEDGSYLRVKNITLSYRIPEKFLLFNYAELYASVNNIFTLSDYLGYDPEFSYSFHQIHQGVDYGLTPQPRQFIAGVKIGF